MMVMAQFCGHTLALYPALISGYLGKSDAFDKALAAFSISYADQSEKDHAALKRAIGNGKIDAVFDEVK